MTPVLLQGTVWGYAAVCDSSSLEKGYVDDADIQYFLFFPTMFCHYKPFPLFPIVFSKDLYYRHMKTSLGNGERVKCYLSCLLFCRV